MDVNFIVDLPIDECEKLLKESIDCEKPFFLQPFSCAKKDIVGYAKESTFRIRKRSLSRNRFATLLYGKFIQEGNHTRVQGEWRIPRLASPITILCLGLAIALFVFKAALLLPMAGKVGLVVFVSLAISILWIGTGASWVKWTQSLRKDVLSYSNPGRNYIVNFLSCLYQVKIDEIDSRVAQDLRLTELE